ncbi:MAG: RIP metalloprotease RseP [Patescibacteria group bacterium]
MSLFLTILVFILIFSLLVLIHELGHFWAAKRAGIRVEEFGFGLPPRVYGKRFGETLYSINFFPFGGFVRLYGEDAHTAAALKDKRSFAGKPLRQRILVVIAGVLMNFLLAILLLTFGFSFGIQSLLIGPDDVFQAIDSGNLQIQSGLVVKDVEGGSDAQKVGFQKGDTIVSLNHDAAFDSSLFQKLMRSDSEKFFTAGVLRGKSFFDFKIEPSGRDFGLQFYEHFVLPRLVFSRLQVDSPFAHAGVQPNDVLLKVNGRNIFSLDEYHRSTQGQKHFSITVSRNLSEMTFDVFSTDIGSILVSEVASDSPAQKAGLIQNDLVVQVERQDVPSAQEATRLIMENREKPVQFLVDRNGQLLTFYVQPNEDGKIGVVLSPLLRGSLQNDFYSTGLLTSVTFVKNVQYPFPQSFLHAFKETYRLGISTVVMFGNLVGQLVTDFSVPEGVSGPVGIAQMTGVFVHEGFFSLVRFTALLSLSLAVMNLLPFPGLDGGRLLFLVIESVRGRRLSAHIEQLIHTIGFVLLMVMIFVVTWKDVMRLF